MADRLRAQAEKFQLNMGKIEAFCLFCEETKKMVKHHWTQHLINHTGELMFACDTCNMKFKNKNDHKNCAGQVMNVFDQNSSDASLMGYMCKDCNYIQFHLSSIENHLVNEHHQLIDELNYEKLMLIPDMSPVHSDVSAKFGFAEASQRFKCTVCQTQLLDALAFTAHFTDKHNDIDEYQCFCGVTVRKNDLIPGNQWVAAHLLMHRSDLHQCMICMGVYLRKKDVLEHILCTHQGNVQIKLQHVCRNPNRNIKLSVSTIQKLICNICQRQVDGSVAHIFDHFNNEHPSKTISITGIGSKKITNLARTQCDTETTYEGGKQMSVRQTNTAT
ncbi:zinc finger protein 423-like [Sitodiplosis mosellana]|uniref:zinc finger protein 423-like n=1 Tax=Sitodiplosis mosellana TaxID=263140 RepID=UPI002443E66E|nr:zinc finger protein 423-like [Sitodiplosis mosellana]